MALLRVLALGLLLAGCGGAGERALAAGRAALKERHFAEALEHYRTATALAPRSARAQAERGAVAEVLGEFDEALAAFQAAARLEPSAARRFRVAGLAERMGQSALAVTLLDADLSTPRLPREAVARSVAGWLDAVERSSAEIGMPWVTLPAEVLAARGSRYGLGQIGRLRYVRDGDVEGATRLLQEAVRLDPRFARPYIHLARIAWDQAERHDAVALLEKAVAVDPDCWRARRNLGKALAVLKRYPEAEGHLRRTVELFGDDTGGRLALAHVLYAQGRYAEYETETRAALQFAERWNQPLPEVRGFLTAYEVAGPGSALPPAPDPEMILGWNAD